MADVRSQDGEKKGVVVLQALSSAIEVPITVNHLHWWRKFLQSPVASGVMKVKEDRAAT